MSFISSVASRYLFSTKGTHFINIISGVTILGLSLGSAALILVMSVFNGFGELIASMMNQFNPELKVLPATGKFFTENDETIKKLKDIEGVDAITKVIEETAAFEYQNIPYFGTLTGVDSSFNKVTSIDSTLIEGNFLLEDDEFQYAVLGSGMARNLSVDVLNAFENLSVLLPDRKASPSSLNPIKKRLIKPAGVFSVQQDIDNQIVLVPLLFAQSILSRTGEISFLGIRLKENANIDVIQTQIQDYLGENYAVQNRFEQDEEFLKLMNIEKWMASLIASLMILLIAFNLVGCLWMIVLDKKKDVAILKALGSTPTMVKKIFLRLGLYYTLLGLVSGIIIAVVLYVIQKEFGIITMEQGFVVDTYPIKMRWTDIFVTSIVVLSIGYLAASMPARRAARLHSSVREA